MLLYYICKKAFWILVFLFQPLISVHLGHSYGNYFDPAKDCSHVVDNVPKTKSGVYWIQTANGPQKVSEIACDSFIHSQNFVVVPSSKLSSAKSLDTSNSLGSLVSIPK